MKTKFRWMTIVLIATLQLAGCASEARVGDLKTMFACWVPSWVVISERRGVIGPVAVVPAWCARRQTSCPRDLPRGSR